MVQNEKKKNESKDKGYIDLFDENNTGIQAEESSDEEQELNQAEKNALAQFDENDQELEKIAGEIATALDHLKETSLNIADRVGTQNQLLKGANSKAKKTESELNQQNNDLKKALEKHKNGK